MVQHRDQLILVRFYERMILIAADIAAVFIKSVFHRRFTRAGKIAHRNFFHSLRFIKPKVGDVHFIIGFSVFSLSVEIIGIVQMHFHFFYNFRPVVKHFAVVRSIDADDRNE